MNTALSWIKAYVPDLTCTDQEYMDAMTLSGTKVEGYARLDKNLEKIVVGQIKKIEKHPDADKLIVCQVDIGGEEIQIVTGAPNVKEGDKVPVVLDGGKVAGGHDGGPLPEDGISIKAGKLRGVPSNGMMCSIEELGSDRNFYPEAPEMGIYIFEDDVQVGADAVEELGLRDTVFEYEVTSNRVDCYSVIGIAREAAATFRKPFVLPAVTAKGNDEKVEDYVSVEVQDQELCPRYCARVCKNIKIAPSPKWMQRRLAASGIRPINNLVDITNYVMEEYGQPMHAFDLDTIAGHKIIVRRAKDGDVFRTLDGQDRNLDSDVLMICDAEKEVGIAGIMGGENSMITDSVTTVLFEAATFNGANIRKSAKRVGLRTDASGKFEKGLDPYNAEAAINRACQLIEELGCGEVVGGMVDVHGEMKEKVVLPFEPERYNSLLGTDVSEQEMLNIFKMIEVEYDAEKRTLTVPTFRQDILRQCDIAEEVARFYGYDKIPTTLPNGEATTGKLPFKLRIEQKARDIAEYCGFSQGMCYNVSDERKAELFAHMDQDSDHGFAYMAGCSIIEMMTMMQEAAVRFDAARKASEQEAVETYTILMNRITLYLTEALCEKPYIYTLKEENGDFTLRNSIAYLIITNRYEAGRKGDGKLMPAGIDNPQFMEKLCEASRVAALTDGPSTLCMMDTKLMSEVAKQWKKAEPVREEFMIYLTQGCGLSYPEAGYYYRRLRSDTNIFLEFASAVRDGAYPSVGMLTIEGVTAQELAQQKNCMMPQAYDALLALRLNPEREKQFEKMQQEEEDKKGFFGKLFKK